MRTTPAAPSAARYSARNLTDASLLNESAPFAAGERSNQVQLLVRIAEIDFRKLYLRAGYSSMLAHCMGEFRFKEDEALKRLHAARAGREYPLLFEALDQGRLSLTAVNLLAPHLTAENAGDLVNAAAGCETISDLRVFLQRFVEPSLLTAPPAEPIGLVVSKRPSEPETPTATDSPSELERTNEPLAGPVHSVVPERPTESVEESEWVELRIKVRRSKLRYARELLAHSVPSGSATRIVDHALSVAIQRAEKRKFAACATPRAPRPRRTSDRRIPAHVRRAVWDRDGGRCTFVSETGRRCATRRLLEFDHIEPVARGGKTSVENLRMRCRGHNQYEAEQAFGAEFMQRKRDEARRERAAKTVRETTTSSASPARLRPAAPSART